VSHGGPRPVENAADARHYLEKAEQYLKAAEDSSESGLHSPAVGNAVHAGILGSDAISAHELKKVWNGEHDGAVRHLQSAGDIGKAASRHLQRLLRVKNRAEYDPISSTPKQAVDAIQSATRLLEFARSALASGEANGSSS
jgi:hypothetical protein